MTYYKTQGVLLRRHNLGEADRILTLLTPDQGKIKVVAKGVRKGRSKMAGHLEPFVVVDLHIAKGRNLDIITSARGQRYYDPAHSQLDQLALAHLLLEICDKVLTEQQPQPEAYALLLEALGAMELGVDPNLVRHYFYVRLLDSLGHRPEIHNELDRQEYYLLLQSGLLSDNRTSEDSAVVSVDTVKLWRLMYANPLEQVARVTTASELASKAQASIERFYDYQFGVRFRSEQILG